MATATTSPHPIPFFADGTATIYWGDSSEILPQLLLRTHDVVHVVTDPPYGIGLDYGHKVDEWRPDSEYWTMLFYSLPTDATLHMTVSNRHLDYWLHEVVDAGWDYLHTSVYWNQGRAGGNWGGQFAYAWEPLLSFTKGKSLRLAKRMLTDVFPHSGSRTTDHPAERNISAWGAFMSHLPAGLVLDPFLGSGTTLRCALNLGRPAIGIEQEERWCREAALRCSQLSLFVS